MSAACSTIRLVALWLTGRSGSGVRPYVDQDGC
jgi:hypothetical protein